MDQPLSDRADAPELVRTLRAIAIGALLLLLCWALWRILPVVFTAVLLAVMLRGASDWAAQRTRTSPHLMLAVISVLVAVLLFGFLYYLGPRLVAQASELWQRLQQFWGMLRNAFGQSAVGQKLLQSLSSAGGGVADHITAYATQMLTFTLGGAAWVLIVVVTALYLAISPSVYVNGAVRLFPLRYRPRARKVLADMGRTLQWWSLGQLIDMAIVGVLACIGLALLGVPLPLALGALAGLLTFVPYFGAIAAAIPAMLVAFTVSWQDAVWTVVIFLVCHGIEGYLMAPFVQRRMVRLPPALSIMSMSALGVLIGPLGVILGTPIAAVALIATREVYVGEVLDDPEIEGAGSLTEKEAARG